MLRISFRTWIPAFAGMTMLLFMQSASAQVVNPTVIYQDTDIALHFTNVYYPPFAPSGSNDTRANLCNESDHLNDLNGVGSPYRDYLPRIYDTSVDSFVYLKNWAPHGTVLGNQVVWQRLFSANDKPNGAHSDLIAGGLPGDSVIISKNEDVDFRATGIIKLKSGFHAKPGCFFHAYTAPKFDTAVFTDDFDSTKFDRSKWYVSNGAQGYNYGIGNECSVDSNISMDTDYQARDGHALDIVLREVPGNCNCALKNFDFFDSTAPNASPPVTDKFAFSTAIVHSFKFPFQVPWYSNFPYGKYEVRDKVPIVEHHLNNWGGGAASEWDLCEKIGGGQFEIHSGISHRYLYGPFKGKFNVETFHIFGGGTVVDTTFRSEDAHWSLSNNPALIVIDGFSYEMGLTLSYINSSHRTVLDTFLTPAGLNKAAFGIPASLKLSTDSFTFYYTKNPTEVSDSLPWHVTQDANGKWRVLYIGYRYLNDDSLKFSKAYQPQTITLHHLLRNAFGLPYDTTVSCHWDYALNSPTDRGLLLLGDTNLSLDFHSGDTAFTYTVDEGPGYPVPPIPIDTTTYKYHKFTMELLPHEMRILLDGNVMRRFPDRLIPPDNKDYDYITKLPRAPMDAYIGEFDIDTPSPDNDSLGIIPGSITYQERKYFEWANTMLSHGCWDVTIGGKAYHAAHHLVDYIDILDLPHDFIVPKYPN